MYYGLLKPTQRFGHIVTALGCAEFCGGWPLSPLTFLFRRFLRNKALRIWVGQNSSQSVSGIDSSVMIAGDANVGTTGRQVAPLRFMVIPDFISLRYLYQALQKLAAYMHRNVADTGCGRLTATRNRNRKDWHAVL